jgi:signal transduction histidine kinase
MPRVAEPGPDRPAAEPRDRSAAEPRDRPPGPRPWRLWSLRARLTIAATALLAAGLAIASLLLATTISRSLVSALDNGALESGRQVAELVNEDRLPDQLSIGSEATAVIQVVDAGDGVVAASANGDRLVPLVEPAELVRVRAGERVIVDGERTGLSGQLRVLGVPAEQDGAPRTVLVASGTTVLRDSQRALRDGLLVGAPLLLVALALVSWRVIGWTLAPVEALRRGADQISAAEITSAERARQRLPVPDARDEVRRLAETLNDMLGRLAAASAGQRAFVSDAAHELRSPLASLRTQLEVAARLGPAETTELATDALLDVQRLSTLVDDLLLLARLDEAPGRTRRREPVELGDLAASVVSRYGSARVPVRVDRSAEVVVPGDPSGLTRVLANLVDNAIRHASAQVTVSVRVADGQGELVVADDGPGIPVADRDRVFDRFTRLDDARARESGGAGLGLAIVRELVRAHGGTVSLRDAAPGLAVVVTLPASAALEREEATR